MKKIAILGAGSYATAVAKMLSTYTNAKIMIWARDEYVCQAINRYKKNPRYLKHIDLGDSVCSSLSIDEVVSQSESIFCLLPISCVREILNRIKTKIEQDTVLISGTKGIEVDTLMTVSEIAKQIVPDAVYSNFVVLSGPSFALELAENKITAVTLAYFRATSKKKVEGLMNSNRFKLVTTRDVIGTEICGALKNIIAIATGIVDGLKLGANARAAVITAGLCEIAQIGIRKGARLDTFLGLAGVGDLVLTCTGSLSRNRFVGEQLAYGRRLEDILSNMDMVAEGVHTIKAAYELAHDLNLSIPLIEQLYAILYQKKNIEQAIETLMAHDLNYNMNRLLTLS